MKVDILQQPDDLACGPTSLHAVYHYHGLEIELDDLIGAVGALEEGGTLAVLLGIDALERGFRATLYTYNLVIFDPTWAGLSSEQLIEKLERQLQYKTGAKLVHATRAYQIFLGAGGRIAFDEPGPRLLEGYFNRGLPVLAGLNATFLYGTAREYLGTDNRSIYDDVVGEPVGHFVVLAGLAEDGVRVADPHRDHPFGNSQQYTVGVERLIHSILMGVVTFDANMLVIEPATVP